VAGSSFDADAPVFKVFTLIMTSLLLLPVLGSVQRYAVYLRSKVVD
jgi:hypothetical protein